ncbi:hypothetical protein SARC_02319 [Sphaeroforma arctica JP610]|uniref:Uncharacterized protein n=1 Tax=Sphaeroforma arctica JP610 TaxID=667725 RepID=A0A0L0GB84_9EUKA|nr:hypothetical protein SARC_02319 [Sphaeroforma arctica JP610]KNC85518.1 hypothetical protein SARC_02319 [Sphaeroforma arctica JP610]|eukprot:XP_014159420.1 hypothetical protein SARC_02319 [Sphaeroforma arctica JP610]
MYSLQAKTDKLIKAQTKPDGSSEHLSGISEKLIASVTTSEQETQPFLTREPLVQDWTYLQGVHPEGREGERAPRRGGPPRGGGQQGGQGRDHPIGQATNTPAPRGPKPCPHCGTNLSPHAYSKCPNKGESNRLKA